MTLKCLWLSFPSITPDSPLIMPPLVPTFQPHQSCFSFSMQKALSWLRTFTHQFSLHGITIFPLIYLLTTFTLQESGWIALTQTLLKQFKLNRAIQFYFLTVPVLFFFFYCTFSSKVHSRIIFLKSDYLPFWFFFQINFKF